MWGLLLLLLGLLTLSKVFSIGFLAFSEDGMLFYVLLGLPLLLSLPFLASSS